MANEIGKATYLRKIGDRQFEYGWYAPPKNYRKEATVYEPVGVAETVAEAEAARAALAPNVAA